MTNYVPHPVVQHIVTVVKEGQEISGEQRSRTNAWLTANGIDPATVALAEISVQYSMRGTEKGRSLIQFTQYVSEGDGRRVFDWRTKSALTVQRLVEQQVELEPDPTWEGWDAWRTEMNAQGKTDMQGKCNA